MKRNQDGLTEQEFLETYEPGDYQRPSVTVDMLVFTLEDDCLKMLLIKRGDHPYLDAWAIPGGFVGIGESLDDAAKRELQEETGLSGLYMEQLYTFGEPERDPRMRVISTSYMTLVPNQNLKVTAGDDAKEAAWFTVKTNGYIDSADRQTHNLILENRELGITMACLVEKKFFKNGVIRTEKMNAVPIAGYEDRLAFDHGTIISLALERLKNKIEYTPIAFNLVDEEFTLPELQKVYEIVLGKGLYKATFRNQMKKYVVETNCKKHIEGVVRDAKCYRYKEN